MTILPRLPHRKPRRPHPRLEVERLEDRLTPANLDVSATGVASLTATPGELEDVTVSLNPGTGLYTFTDNGAVFTVTGAGSGAGQANVQGAGTNTVTARASFLTSISIDTGDLAGFVHLQSTAVPTTIATTSSAVSATPTITLGAAGSVQGITAPVSVSNANALSTLVVDDSADPLSQTVSMSDTSITGLAPAAINYVPADIGSLTVNGGTGTNVFTVTNTVGGITTTLNAGTGVETVSVLAGSGGSTLNVNAGLGHDLFRVVPSAVATFNFNGGPTTLGTINVLDYRGNGTVTPNGTGAGTITGTGVNPVTFTGINTTLVGPGSLQFSAPTYVVGENGVTAQITVTRTGGAFGQVSATFATDGGTGVAGQDFTATTQTVIFGDDDLAPKTVAIPILNDQFVDQNKTVNLTLSNPTGGATLGTPSTAVLTIFETNQPFDVTGETKVVFGKVKGTRKARQKVTLTNQSPGHQTFVGPLDLVLKGLNSKITLTNGSGVNSAGNPIFIITSDLAPGASTSAVLVFSNPKGRRIKYSLQIFALGGLR